VDANALCVGQRPKIAIIGGGLAGLAAANALATFDFDAEVFEQAPSLGEIGAGINISPQAVKVLRAVGLGEKLVAAANLSKGIFTRDMHSGQELEFRDTRGAESIYGAPFLTFHRADLMNVLAGGVSPDRIHLGHRLVEFEEHERDIRLTFANGSTHDADILIAADGIHSVVRHALYGDDNPSYTGQMVWRALLQGSDVPPEVLEPSGHIRWVGPGRHFYGYYLRGRDVVNIVTQEETSKWVEEGWSIAGDPDEMRGGFPNPEPRLATLLGIVSSCSKWGLFMRPLTDKWGRGRIQLIGDAAHAMLPNAGQGAGQAFEDAYILSRWLEAERDPVEALASFRRIRIPRVHAIQRRSAANARIYQMQDREARNVALSKTEARRGSMEWIVAYDPIDGWNKPPVIPENA
jgi:salicylate hydroxylase